VFDYDVESEDAGLRTGDLTALVDVLALLLRPIVTCRARELDESTEDDYRRAVAAASPDRASSRQGRAPLIDAVLAPEDERVLLGTFTSHLTSITVRPQTNSDPDLLHELA
jgi:hypothetical protein